MNAAHSISAYRGVCDIAKYCNMAPTMISLLKGNAVYHYAQEQSSEAAAQSAIAGVCDGTHGKAQAMHQEAMAKLDHGWLRKGWLAQSFANQREES